MPFFDCEVVAEIPEGCKVGIGTLRSKNIGADAVSSEVTPKKLTKKLLSAYLIRYISTRKNSDTGVTVFRESPRSRMSGIDSLQACRSWKFSNPIVPHPMSMFSVYVVFPTPRCLFPTVTFHPVARDVLPSRESVGTFGMVIYPVSTV